MPDDLPDDVPLDQAGDQAVVVAAQQLRTGKESACFAGRKPNRGGRRLWPLALKI